VRRTLAIGAGVAVVVAVLAGSAASSDIYITGQVLARVPGKNMAAVQIAWDYKCLGEKGGDYEWNLKLTRTQPPPEKTVALGSGTTERGDTTTRLAPGRYLPTSNPYLCETSRGQGYDQPEIGAPFTVPDYCAWTVSSVRGVVQLEHETSVKLAKPGAVVAQGDALVTPRSGRAKLASVGRDGTVALGDGSRLEVDRKHCPRTAGWKVRLDEGVVTVAVPAGASSKAVFTTVTRNASASGGPGARWRLEYTKRRTKVRALAGRVRVGAKTLRAGQTATV
jgi:hypothetical protein